MSTVNAGISGEPSQKRRSRNRLAILAAVLLLLPAYYVGTWLAVSKAATHHLIGFRVTSAVRSAFVPLIDYCNSDKPGARCLSRIYWWVNTRREANGRVSTVGGPLSPWPRVSDIPQRDTTPPSTTEPPSSRSIRQSSQL